VSWLIYVSIGLCIGWLSAAIAEVDAGIFARMGVGALGAAFGVTLSAMFVDGAAMDHISLLSVILAVVCSVLLTNMIYRPRDEKIT
jgi:uncharacterized membrane protein YeaQ/YmgE (transglycosylase-associated protein family)